MLCVKCKKEIPAGSTFCNWCGSKQAKAEHKPKTRGNGQGSVYKLPNGTWRVAVTDGYKLDGDSKKRIYKTKTGFKTKKEAIEYLPKLQQQERKKEITVLSLYELWSKSHFATIGKSKQSTYKTAFKKISALHFRKISELRLSDMQQIIDNIEGGFYPKQDIKVLMNNLFKYAMIEDYCNKNYAEFIKLPPLEKSKKDAFTRSEVATLWWDYRKGNKFTGYILLMIYTGMRYGEISIIEKDRVFLDQQYMIGGIKTDAGKDREIMIPDKLLKITTEIYNNGKQKLLEISEEDFYDNFNNTIKRLGMREILKPHCCRHTFATMSAQKGIQPAIIKEIAGHKNYSTTLGYTHIAKKNKLEAVNKL